MSVFFWLSIALWLLSLICFALMLSARERRQRRRDRTPAYVPLEALIDRAGEARVAKILYRTLVTAIAGALLCGALYLLWGV